MIDPITTLAFSLHSNKGVYALLLGSGVSRAAAIPTGWEVVLDLTRKLAKMENEQCEPEPEAWFRRKHGIDPGYSQLLDDLAKTAAERQQLLRSYFEPTEDERAQGLKVPTVAHRSVAQLISAGYIRIVITTNFDRLMEKALDELGIAPTVISTPDQIAGALPLAHSGVTIIKMHGDYLDTRLLNTPAELAKYDARLDRLIDQIIDEYGLIVCGWSSDWDTALRAAIERCPCRRFSTFWAIRSPLSEQAKKLADRRKAEIVQIADANHFFQGLLEKVQSLADVSAPHPLSSKLAVATLKRYLADPTSKIRLRDLIHDETERLYIALNKDELLPHSTRGVAPEELTDRLAKYHALTENLLAMITTGCHWASTEQAKLWARSLERIANPTEHAAGYDVLNNLRKYPALLLLYAAGLASVTASNYECLLILLTVPRIHQNGRAIDLPLSLFPTAVMEREVGHVLPGMDRRYTPLNDLLNSTLLPVLRDYIPQEVQYQQIFDRFEYIFGLVYFDFNLRTSDIEWGPVGRFHWRHRHAPENRITRIVAEEVKSQGVNWPPLKAGFFGSSLTRLQEIVAKYDAHLKEIRWF